MLPRAVRLTGAQDFRQVVRRGIRVGRPTLVIHAAHSPARSGVRVGFVVARSVGGAVVRNRVRRRLRHLAAERLATTPAGTDLVIRALPAAASAAALPADLGRAWAQAVATLTRPPTGPAGR